MADLYITEYRALAQDSTGHLIAAGLEPSLAEQVIANPVASTASAALSSATHFVMVKADGGDMHLKFGTAPTAVNTAHLISAGETRFYGVQPGLSIKIAAINGA